VLASFARTMQAPAVIAGAACRVRWLLKSDVRVAGGKDVDMKALYKRMEELKHMTDKLHGKDKFRVHEDL
jgi:hypothetical protein